MTEVSVWTISLDGANDQSICLCGQLAWRAPMTKLYAFEQSTLNFSKMLITY